jgi:protoheme IX farnesyltransferase
MTGSRRLVRDYVALTKPRIIVLLLLTALCGMFLAAGGIPDTNLVLLVLGGGALAAGGAHSLNHWFERDIDSLMVRTRSRPVASGRVSPREALFFGAALNVIAFIILGALVNPLSAVLTLSATLFYILVYTAALKRTTPQSIVIGGAAGAIPPLVGWAAITGGLGLPAIYLFAIIFMWTPPHFWALALLIKDDYAMAKIPMLPVVKSVAETKRSILVYTIALVTLTLMFAATGAVGWFYVTSATVLGAAYIFYSWRLYKGPEIVGARQAYLFSLLYLALLFAAIATDVFVRI